MPRKKNKPAAKATTPGAQRVSAPQDPSLSGGGDAGAALGMLERDALNQATASATTTGNTKVGATSVKGPAVGKSKKKRATSASAAQDTPPPPQPSGMDTVGLGMLEADALAKATSSGKKKGGGTLASAGTPGAVSIGSNQSESRVNRKMRSAGGANTQEARKVTRDSGAVSSSKPSALVASKVLANDSIPGRSAASGPEEEYVGVPMKSSSGSAIPSATPVTGPSQRVSAKVSTADASGGHSSAASVPKEEEEVKDVPMATSSGSVAPSIQASTTVNQDIDEESERDIMTTSMASIVQSTVTSSVATSVVASASPTIDITQEGVSEHDPELGETMGTKGVIEYDYTEYPKGEILDTAVVVEVMDDDVVVVEAGEEQRERRRIVRKVSLIGVSLLIVGIIGVVVAVFLSIGDDETKSTAPSMAPSMAPTSNAFFDIARIISESNISPSNSLEDRKSPQAKALRWLSNDNYSKTLLENDNEDRLLTRYILAVTYFATGGDNWTNCNRNSPICGQSSNFLSDISECDWFGVICSNDIPLGLTIANNNMKGKLPVELFKMTSLVNLSLPVNNIYGSLPTDIGALTNLMELRLYSNAITGTLPTSLFTIPQLQIISLRNNQLSGNLDDEMFAMEYLVELYLSNNSFSGTIPQNLGQLQYFEKLFLYKNNLRGGIPESLYTISSLKEIVLYTNELDGPILPDIGNLQSLKKFSVENNKLTGTLPKEIFSSPVLSAVGLDYNSFEGSIPESFYNATSLTEVTFTNNSLTGTLSNQMGNLVESVTMLFHSNQFQGTIPASIGNLSKLEYLSFKENNFNGSVDPSICALSIEKLEVDCDEVSCSCCTNCE